MGLLDRLRRKKAEEIHLKSAESVTKLEQRLGKNRSVYKALFNVMFLDPRKIDVSIEEAAEKARNLEKEKDILRARAWYEIAGGLAIYEGDVKKVVEYFSRCEKISPEKEYSILKDPEEAVAEAQKFYKEHLNKKA